MNLQVNPERYVNPRRIHAASGLSQKMAAKQEGAAS